MAQFIELSIGSLILALAVMFKRILIETYPLNRERLVLFPDAAVVSRASRRLAYATTSSWWGYMGLYCM